jgi:group I intron endonuclease
MYKIYLITNKLNNKKYIGQTKQKLKSRFIGHKSKANKGSKIVFHSAIRKYGIENFEIILLEENINNIEISNQREIEFIKQYNTLLPNGYNTLEGGLNQISSRKGINLSPEHKTKIKNSHKKNSKPIIEFNIETGKTIKEWSSGRELLRNNFSRANISQICKSDKKFGYMYNSGWCYKTFYDTIKDKKILIKLYYNAHGKTIKCLDIDGNIIKIYNKIVDAARELKCSPCSIQDCIKGRIKTCKGFIWQYC